MFKSKWILVFFFIISSQVCVAAPVNINTANAQEIAKALYGVGKHKANAIVQYRTKHGPFKTIEGIKKVKGIGQAIVAGNGGDIQID
mgnify:CR=1 FL=1